MHPKTLETIPRLALSCVAMTLSVSCAGQLEVENLFGGDDMDASPGLDKGPDPVTQDMDTTTTRDMPAAPGDMGQMQTQDDGGDTPDMREPPPVDMGPADPCASVSCGSDALCVSGECRCAPGFLDVSGACTPAPVGDPSTRTREQVCTRWQDDRAPRASTTWSVEPLDDCDPGVLHPEVVEDAIRRTNLYRWLSGLAPLSVADQQLGITQACATTLAATGRGLSHDITDNGSWTCYSDDASSGARSSNIALGVTRPSDSVDLYVVDRGVPSLGHRRWVLNPAMGKTAFGQRGRYSCMYAFDRSQSEPAPDYFGYPSAGFFPTRALSGQWSYASSTWAPNSDTEVAVTRTDTGDALTVSGVNMPATGGFAAGRPPMIAWTVAGAPSDVELEITLTKLGRDRDESFTYRTTLVPCN